MPARKTPALVKKAAPTAKSRGKPAPKAGKAATTAAAKTRASKTQKSSAGKKHAAVRKAPVRKTKLQPGKTLKKCAFRQYALKDPRNRHASQVSKEEQAAISEQMRRILVKRGCETRYRVAKSEVTQQLLEELFGIEMAARSARRWVQTKRKMVRKVRQALRSVMSARTTAYLKRCAERGVAPGALAGRDFPAWR